MEDARAEDGNRLSETGTDVVSVLESIGDAFFAVDNEWQFIYVNRHAEPLLQRKREDLLGKKLWDEFPEAVDSSFSHNYRRAVESGEAVTFEGYYPPLDTWFEVHVYPSPGGLAVYFSDISRRLEEAAERERLLRAEREERARAEIVADRMARLHRASTALSNVLSPIEVAQVVVEQALTALDADAGTLSVLSPGQTALEVIHSVGYDPELVEQYRWIGRDEDTPISTAWLTGEPIWLESGEAWRERYPQVDVNRQVQAFRSAIAIPLVVEGRMLGNLGLSFKRDRKFGLEDRVFVTALAQSCAQALDRTRLYEAERQALAEAETQRARLHSLFMQAPAIISVTTGPDHVIELANPGFLQLVGQRDVVRKPIREAMPELTAQAFLELFDQVYRSGQPFIGIDMPIAFDRDGSGTVQERFCNLVLQPTHNSLGEIDGLMVHAVDVTDQVLALRRIEHLAAEREAILSQIADGIIIADVEGRITYVNEAAERMLGISGVGVAIPQFAETFFPFQPGGEPFASEELPLSRAVLQGETVLDVDILIRRPDRAETIIQANAAPLRGEDERRLGAVVTFRDVTDRRTLDRQKDDFLAAAAHDLRTPLTTIKGQAQILKRRAASTGNPEMRPLIEGLARIDATSTKMATLINRLLDLTRLQMNQPLDLLLRPANLIEILEQVLADHRQSTGQHRLILESERAELTGVWDAFRLERVFANLLSNATKYSPEGGDVVVTVRTEERGGTPWVIVSVSDHGIGIPADAVAHIYERFYRASNVGQDIPGVGIGLAGALQIVEQHGGELSVESAEGEGATFSVALPIKVGDG